MAVVDCWVHITDRFIEGEIEWYLHVLLNSVPRVGDYMFLSEEDGNDHKVEKLIYSVCGDVSIYLETHCWGLWCRDCLDIDDNEFRMPNISLPRMANEECWRGVDWIKEEVRTHWNGSKWIKSGDKFSKGPLCHKLVYGASWN